MLRTGNLLPLKQRILAGLSSVCLLSACGGVDAPSLSTALKASGAGSELETLALESSEDLSLEDRALCGIVATTAPGIADLSLSGKEDSDRLVHPLVLKLVDAPGCPIAQNIVLRVQGAEERKSHSRPWSILDMGAGPDLRPSSGQSSRVFTLGKGKALNVNLGFLPQKSSSGDDLWLFLRRADDNGLNNESRLQICGVGACNKETRCGPKAGTRGKAIGNKHTDEDSAFACYLTPGIQ